MSTVATGPVSRDDLDQYVRTLDYDPAVLLSVKPDGATESRPAERERASAGNAVIVTTRTRRSLQVNLSDVAILKPTTGIVFPGALVIADERLADGQPTPIGLPQGPIVVSVDLPGLANSGKDIPNPTFSTVQEAITDLVEQWISTSASRDYINTARSFLEVQTMFSSQQVALSLGFSAKWAGGNASAQLDTSSNSESSSVLAYFKQVFYTATVDTPARPSQMFAESVSLQEIQQVISDRRPPAYVRSVDYGRILMIRMETSSRESRADLQAAVRHVTAGGPELQGQVDARFANIVRNAKFTAVAIGGGAQAAAQFSGSEQDLRNLRTFIHEGAALRRGNPGAPIAYVVAFLKDHAIAKMGFSTDWTETESVTHPNGFVRVKHEGGYVGRFEITWEEGDERGSFHPRRWESGDKTAGYSFQLDLPGDARNIRLRAWAATGLVWDPWGEALNVTLNGPDQKCYRIHGTTLNRRWDNDC